MVHKLSYYMTESGKPRFPDGTMLDQYKIQSMIGSGGYGDIYAVEDPVSHQLRAMKVEYLGALKSGLLDEIAFLEMLQDSSYFPKYYAKGMTGSAKYCVMELLGPSLSKLRRMCKDKRFSQYTYLKLSIDMLNAIEVFHRHGYVHRDIKPGNFLIRANRNQPITLIDFGLSRSYLNSFSKKHIPFSNDAGFTGTCRYASLNAHKGHELSRRDDLISWFYTVLEMATSELPWPGAKDREQTFLIKSKIKISKLCKKLPQEFVEILKSLKELQFEQEPPYELYRNLLEQAVQRLFPHPLPFDWESFPKESLSQISWIPLDMPPLPEYPAENLEFDSSPGGCAPCSIA